MSEGHEGREKYMKNPIQAGRACKKCDCDEGLYYKCDYRGLIRDEFFCLKCGPHDWVNDFTDERNWINDFIKEHRVERVIVVYK